MCTIALSAAMMRIGMNHAPIVHPWGRLRQALHGARIAPARCRGT